MKQVIPGGNSLYALNNTATTYNSLQAGEAWVTLNYRYKQVISISGSISLLSGELSAAPGAGATYTFTLEVNGVASALTITFGAADTQKIDTVNSVNVAAGDTVQLICTYTGAPGTPTAKWSSIFTGSTAKHSLILGTAFQDIAANRYYPLQSTHYLAYSATEAPAANLIPTSGTIKNLYVALRLDPGAPPDAYTFTVYKNGVATALTVTIVANNTTGNDTIHSVAVAAGDLVSIEVMPVDTPTVATYVYFGTCFEANIDGESIIMGTLTTNPDDTLVMYRPLITYLTTAWNATASRSYQQMQNLTPGVVLRKFYVKQDTAPGAGGSSNNLNYTIIADGGATSITVDIFEVATSGNDLVHTYTCLSYDTVYVACTPTSTPTVSPTRWGLVCYISPGRIVMSSPLNVLIMSKILG